MEFAYQVKEAGGSLLNGTIEAPDENTAVATLQQKGYVVLSLDVAKKSIFSGGDVLQYFNRPKPKDLTNFTRLLSTLLEVDIPLVEGMRTLANQADNPAFARIILDVTDQLEGGASLSIACAAHPKVFSQFYVKLVRSGEISGRLPQTLQYLADYLERNQALGSKVRNALAYPAFVVFTMAVVAVIMVVYVLPQLLVIFKESGSTDLPFTTRMLIGFTDFVHNHLVLLIILFIAIVGGTIQWLRTPSGHHWLDRFKVHVPLFGIIMRSLYQGRIAENMSVLIKSDVAILDALRVTSDLVGNIVYRDILLQAEEQVRGGGSVSEVMRKYHYEISPLMSSMVAIGERTGRLDAMFEHVSTFFRVDSSERIDSIATLIEPVLVVILGLGVALLVAAVLLPLYSISSFSG